MSVSSFRPAVRQGVGLLVGISGCSGSGKTLSAMRLARGLAADPGDDLDDGKTRAAVDARIAFIDTEAGRALHYAPSEGEAPGAFTFGFAHAELVAPFEPEAYLGKIAEAEAAGFRVVVIDSFSHVWAGDGGLQDIHDDELDRAVERARKRATENGWKFDADREREKASVGAWRAPKTRHKRMVSRLLQSRAHLVICMRAEDKMRMETKEETGRGGKTYSRTEITPAEKLPPAERWQPICEKRFPYELITSLLLTPDKPGVVLPLKLQEQHRDDVLTNRPLDESVGRKLGAWARGQKPAQARPVRAADFPPAADSVVAADLPGGGGADDFPGDRPAPDPYSDAAPDSERPRALELQEPMTKQAWQLWAKSFRELTESAPRPRAWRAANDDALQQLAAVSPAAHAWALEFCPPDPPSNGEHTHGQET